MRREVRSHEPGVSKNKAYRFIFRHALYSVFCLRVQWYNRYMGFYNQEQQLFQESIRRFCEKEVLPFVDTWEKDLYFPDEIFQKLGAQGFLGTLIGETYGGVGGDYLLAGAWCEAFGRVPANGFVIAINMHALVISPAIERFGSNEMKERFLPQAVEGKSIGAYAFTEPDAGSDLTNVRTTATLDGDEYVLNGAKIFITNGKRADFVIVLARTDMDAGYDGYTSFVVDTSLPGFSVSRTLSKLGWHSSDTAELVFEDMRIPKNMVLGDVGKGWYQAMTSLEWERLMLSLSALGGARQCLEDSIIYVNDRKVFGKSVGSYDVNRDSIVGLWSRLEAAEAYAHKCLRLLSEGKRCRKEVSLCKLSSCNLAIEIADTCLQLHGGYGYTTEFLPERWLRDLRLNTIGGGTNEIMQKIAAKEIFRP